MSRDKVISVIEEHKKGTDSVIKELHDLKKLEKQNRARYAELEKKKWEQFCNIIEDQQYFRQEHIDRLKLNPNIVICLTAKKAGKTTEIYRMMRRVIQRGEKFMYGRVYRDELDKQVLEFNENEECPIYAVEYKRTYYFFNKGEVQAWQESQQKDEETDLEISLSPTFKKLREYGLEYVGKGYTFYQANCLSGGKYEGYNTIFFDEILSYNPVNRVNERVMNAWTVSLNTIQRNKPDLRVYMYGNLLNRPDLAILNYYDVDINDNLRIIDRGYVGRTRILYINAGGRYKNCQRNEGGAEHHGTLEHQFFLKDNKQLKTTNKILSPSIYASFEHVTSFAARVLTTPYYVELREYRHKNAKEPIYMITAKELSISVILDGPIYAEDPIIYNCFQNTTQRYTIETPFNMIYSLFRSRELYFDSELTLENYNLIVRGNQSQIYENKYPPIPII